MVPLGAVSVTVPEQADVEGGTAHGGRAGHGVKVEIQPAQPAMLPNCEVVTGVPVATPPEYAIQLRWTVCTPEKPQVPTHWEVPEVTHP